ncbi:family A1 protease [Wolfiporia cocos MD-104 SS10]|uniref:Family A1 protease n=1 Tax=Wolfiporia cocos (strain MD-104) TaxID=742152 RepID=A0A2H3IW55_WOLCO|nr:family A1 protease [Wolfiporia cocos MD-104 SS10]
MALGSSLLATLILALAVAAKPVEIVDNLVHLPLVKRTNAANITNVLQRDQARAQALKNPKSQAHKRRASGSISATNQAEDYVVEVGIGSSGTTYTLLVDTGSSNTWVGAGKSFESSSTTVDTGDSVSVSYGSGSFSGTEYEDTVTLGSLTIQKQSFGVASQAEGFSGVDGIIGIGPVDLTEDTVNGVDEVPTVTDNLYSQGQISENLVSVYFAPTTSEDDTNGELTFGGTDSSKYTGSINYVDTTSTSPASYYWGIDESITYGSSGETILSSTAGIVDTGTTLVLIATNAYSKYQSVTGATEDESTGLLRLSSSQYDNLESLYFNIGSESYELTPNAQIWPRSLNSAIGGSSDDIYLIVNSIGTPSGEGLDFINGYTFLERYYSVFDTGNSRVGFATTSYTDATSN